MDVLAAKDITEQPEIPDALRQSEIRYRRLFEAAHDGVLILDSVSRKITDANPFMDHLLGYPHEELLSKELWEIGLLKDEQASHAAFQELQQKGQVRYDDLPLETKSGDKREVEIVANRYEEGDKQVIQCNIRDNTERKRNEEALRASEERFRALFELGPTAIYSCDTSGVIQEFNHRAAELWGREPAPGDLDERFCGSFRMFRSDGSFMPHELCPMADVLSGRISEARDAEVFIERPDGSRVVVVVNIRPLANQRGEVTGAINCFYDITERKRHDEQQELLLREMDHRIKNLFAITGGVVSLSARSATTPQEMATTIHGRLGALATAHQLVRPRRTGAGAAQQGTTLAEIVQTVLRPHVGPADADAESRAVIAGPEVAVSGDAVTSLAMILHELATNAAKYGAFSKPEGRVHVAWSVKKRRLELAWTERGGPPVKGPPKREGFGSLLARRSINGQLDGAIAFDWNPEGVTVHLSAAAERLAPKSVGSA